VKEIRDHYPCSLFHVASREKYTLTHRQRMIRQYTLSSCMSLVIVFVLLTCLLCLPTATGDTVHSAILSSSDAELVDRFHPSTFEFMDLEVDEIDVTSYVVGLHRSKSSSNSMLWLVAPGVGTVFEMSFDTCFFVFFFVV
jgi:hypothetical protein